MFENFLNELDSALENAGVADKEKVLADYRAQFEVLSANGKSEFEIIVYFGEPEEIAAKLADPARAVTPEEQLLSNPLLADDQNARRRNPKDDAPIRNTTPESEQNGAQKRYTKTSIILTDVFYYGLMCALELFGLVLLAGLTALSFGAACVWLVKSFTEMPDAGSKAGAFFITLFVIALCALMAYVGYRLVKSFISFSKEYFDEREKKLSLLK